MPTREFIQENQIVRYHLGAENREELEAWRDLVRQTINEWDTSLPYLSLQDFRQANALTPSLRAYAKELNEYILTFYFPRIRVAVLVTGTPVTLIARYFANRELRNKRIQRQIFFDQNNAIQWLLGDE